MIKEQTIYKSRFNYWTYIGSILAVLLALIVIVLSDEKEHVLIPYMFAAMSVIVLVPYILSYTVIREPLLLGLFSVSFFAVMKDGGIYYAAGWSVLLVLLILPYYINRCITLCFVIKYRKLFAAALGKDGIVKIAAYLQFANEYIIEVNGDRFDAVAILNTKIAVGETVTVKKQKGTYLIIEKPAWFYMTEVHNSGT
ncbi:MAG: hypothetical protein LBH00_09345 [Planctomycetaceae bacterium]|jgi:membrane-bound ClpP family serine protease|nr:hypothetical protein [Planctomycetaceae bacterium]